MKSSSTPTIRFAIIVLALSAGGAWAQHHDASRPHQDQKPAAPATTEKRGADPYPFDTCPTSGKKLGEMGDPVVKLFEGREVRFCCPACPPKFEKDLAASLAKIDEQAIKDQGPLYPVKTSVVTGKDLPEKPYEFVYGNRLIRLGADSEKADFLKDPKKHLAALDEAVIAAQGEHYPLARCPVSGEAFGGEMGEPVDMVVAGRLIRLCCKGCKEDLEENPAKFIAMVDAAQKGEGAQPDHHDGDKDEPHRHK
jgi:hypothetical protein